MLRINTDCFLLDVLDTSRHCEDGSLRDSITARSQPTDWFESGAEAHTKARRAKQLSEDVSQHCSTGCNISFV